MVKKFWKTKAGKVDIAGLMDNSKVSISTTIKMSDRKFIIENGLKYSVLLTQIINEYRGIQNGDGQTKEQIQELLSKWVMKFNRLQRHLVKVVGEDKTAEFIKESEYIDKVLAKQEALKK